MHHHRRGRRNEVVGWLRHCSLGSSRSHLMQRMLFFTGMYFVRALDSQLSACASLDDASTCAMHDSNAIETLANIMHYTVQTIVYEKATERPAPAVRRGAMTSLHRCVACVDPHSARRFASPAGFAGMLALTSCCQISVREAWKHMYDDTRRAPEHLSSLA